MWGAVLQIIHKKGKRGGQDCPEKVTSPHREIDYYSDRHGA